VILDLAAGIVSCVEDKNISSILESATTLGTVARQFIRKRLEATSGMLNTVTSELSLLSRLDILTRGQKKLARETDTLSLLTNIEVARLGQVGDGFQYLAHELVEFSRFVGADTKELMGHIEERKVAIDDAKRKLSVELPRMRSEFTRIEGDLCTALAVVDSGLTKLASMPLQFRSCMQESAEQITGVVAAVQAQDITRQQLEHVEESLVLVEQMMQGQHADKSASNQPWQQAYAGLTIQTYQLKAVQQTVASWASQIQVCMTGIASISSTEVAGIGPLVLQQESELSSQLSRIEALEVECRSYSETLQHTLGGISELMRLVGEHLRKSTNVRDRLRLLTFNSIIEANRLGNKADAIMTISHRIKGISSMWDDITEQSASAMQAIMELAEGTHTLMEVFSQSSEDELHGAQAETKRGLEQLRNVVSCASQRANEMESATDKLLTISSDTNFAKDAFNASCTALRAVMGEIERVRDYLTSNHAGASNMSQNRNDAESVFCSNYTTEFERDVARAALRGEALPDVHQALACSTVELF
jgi:hypothetical protein